MTARAPDLEAEQELDLGSLWASIVARWWLPVAGLVAGAVLGYIVALGGGATYQAEATVYLGQPLSPSGGAQVQGLATKISSMRAEIAADESEIASIDTRLAVYDKAAQSGSTTDRLLILTQAGLAQSRRGIVQQDLTSAKTLLSLALTVEQGKVVTRA